MSIVTLLNTFLFCNICMMETKIFYCILWSLTVLQKPISFSSFCEEKIHIKKPSFTTLPNWKSVLKSSILLPLLVASLHCCINLVLMFVVHKIMVQCCYYILCIWICIYHHNIKKNKSKAVKIIIKSNCMLYFQCNKSLDQCDFCSFRV